MHTLHLEINGIGDGGAIAIANLIAANTKGLKKIMLDDNVISDRGAAALAAALRSNNVLEELDISANEIDNDGADMFATALHGTSFFISLLSPEKTD